LSDAIIAVIAVGVGSRYLIVRKLGGAAAKGPGQRPFCDFGNPELTDFVVLDFAPAAR
jgi:hypothetical protein